MNDSRKRYIGLDVHKHYQIALGVDADLNVVLPARRVELFRLEAWMNKCNPSYSPRHFVVASKLQTGGSYVQRSQGRIRRKVQTHCP